MVGRMRRHTGSKGEVEKEGAGGLGSFDYKTVDICNPMGYTLG